MAYEFKKLSAVEAVETPADTANVLIEEDGKIKKTPSGVFTGGGADFDAVFEYTAPSNVTDVNVTLKSGSIAKAYEKALRGEHPNVAFVYSYTYGPMEFTNRYYPVHIFAGAGGINFIVFGGMSGAKQVIAKVECSADEERVTAVIVYTLPVTPA
jgi:hypothetical protein